MRMAESHTAGQQALMQHGGDSKFRAAPEIRAQIRIHAARAKHWGASEADSKTLHVTVLDQQGL